MKSIKKFIRLFKSVAFKPIGRRGAGFGIRLAGPQGLFSRRARRGAFGLNFFPQGIFARREGFGIRPKRWLKLSGALAGKIPSALFIAFFPLALFASSTSEITAQAAADMEASVIRKSKAELDACLGECKQECGQKFAKEIRNECYHGREGNQVNRDCVSQINFKKSKACTDEKCSQGQCQSQQAKYDENKSILSDMKEQQAEADQREREEAESAVSEAQAASESALSQARDKQKDMQLYSALGAGVTAVLGYKAVSCCAAPGCRESGWCPVLLVGAAAAGIQTKNMLKQADNMGDTVQALCADEDCLGPGWRRPEDEEFRPRSEDKSPKTADEGNPDPQGPCKGHAPPKNCERVADTLQTTAALTGDTAADLKTVAAALDEAFQPKDGWPEGEGPFTKGAAGFNYGDDSLSPKQKNYLKNAAKGINQANKDFLAKHGLGGADDGLDGGGLADELSNSGAGKHLVAGFAGGESAPGLKPPARGTNSAKSGKKSPLADKLQKALENLYGKGGSGSDKSSFGDKSVQFGSDVVGVAEDNIFMMVHRRHRALDEDSRFIQEAF